MKRRAYANLKFSKIDTERNRRCGFEEIIYAPGKTLEQLKEICNFFLHSRRPLILTRLEQAVYKELKTTFPKLKFNRIARVAFFLPASGYSIKRTFGRVLIVSAGTSDTPVSEEVFSILKALRVPVSRLYDVGVAGVQRLLINQNKLRKANCIIVVAGMDAALASVVAGLVKTPVIAVPTSCGYGSHFKGLASLLSMLNSCSAGVGVVNIDNGFGAAVLAAKILRRK